MVKKILLILLTFSNAALLLLVLCLGAQNLKDRTSVNIGISKTPPYPNGFLLGVSKTIGFISGGTSSALLIPKKN